MKFGLTPNKSLPLDSEYRRRWMEFAHADGTVDDSRKVNWKQIRWNDLIELRVFMNGQTHKVTAIDNNFKFFITFRCGGRTDTYKDGKYAGSNPINEWVIGWSDGENVFLKYIDFYTGNLLKETVESLKNHKIHLHPTI